MDLLQLLIVLLELPQQFFRGAAIVDKRSLEGLDHDILPKLINYYEFFVLLRQLLLDILCTENVLQIHPLSLTSQPLIDDLRDQKQSFLNDLHTLSDFCDVT